MNFLKNWVGKKEKNPLKNLQHAWATFIKGYRRMLEQDSNTVATRIMHSSEVKGALKEIVQILLEEDKRHYQSSGGLE